MNLRQAATLGGQSALATFGLPGIGPSKTAFNVGMGASQASSGAGASRGDPADTGRRQRSVIERAFQRNEDDHATSSMPAPGGAVSP